MAFRIRGLKTEQMSRDSEGRPVGPEHRRSLFRSPKSRTETRPPCLHLLEERGEGIDYVFSGAS